MTTCRHTFTPCDVPQYERCTICGTYHSLGALDPKEVYDKDYWLDTGPHGSLKDHNSNVEKHLENGVSKNEFVMSLIWTQDTSGALEIACSPGSLLNRLRDRFDEVVGVEVDQAYEKDIREMAGGEKKGLYLRFGYFPEATRHTEPGFSLIVGLDIFEHAHDPEAFLAECHRLLKPGGQLLLMMPMANSWKWQTDYRPPDRFFHPIEHVYIHSDDHVQTLLLGHGFTNIEFDRWCPGHETVTARKI